MCGLCGILGGTAHWTESARSPQAFGQRNQTHTAQRERIDRTALVNQVLRHYRLNLKSWSNASYALKSSTGKTALVDNLSQMWVEAERMTQQSFDPLDPALIEALTNQQDST